MMKGDCSLRNSIHKDCHQNCNYCRLLKCGWYWRGITKKEASNLLAGENDNVFLIRDSSDSRHLLCLSFRCMGRTMHIRLEHANGLYSLDSKTFVPPIQLLEHCTTVQVESEQLRCAIKLTKPINRFAKLDSLQMICRFVIRQTVLPEDWDKLPLPRNLISYVSKGSDYFCTT